MRKIVVGETPRARAADATIPAALEAVCSRAMAKARSERYASAKELAEEVQCWLADEPVLAHRESAVERLGRWLRRHRSWTQAGSAALLVVAVVSAVAALAINRARNLAEERRKDAVFQRGVAEARRTEADRERYKASYRLAHNDLDRGLGFCEQGDSRTGILWLARSLEDAPPEASDLLHCIRTNLRAWSRQCHVPLRCLRVGPVSAVAFGANGTMIVTATTDGTVRRWSVSTGQSLMNPISYGAGARPAVFGPDGRTVLVSHRSRLWRLHDVATGEPVTPPMDFELSFNALAWSSDGKMAVVEDGGGTSLRWDVATGKTLGKVTTYPLYVRCVALSPDGKTLVTGAGLPGIGGGRNSNMVGSARLWDTATGQPLGPAIKLESDVIAVAFGPDGKTIATGVGGAVSGAPLRWALSSGTVRMWDAASSAPVGSPQMGTAGVCSLAFSPDGKSLLAGDASGVARLWDVVTGQPIGQPMQQHRAVKAIFSPDGKTVLTWTEDGTVYLWRLSETPRSSPP